jgi:ribonuclease HII
MNKTVVKAERALNHYIVGIDEVGRGPVAGPVAVGVVWYETRYHTDLVQAFPKITDSKKVPVNRRRAFAEKAELLRKEGKLHYSIQYVTAKEIDKVGISVAIQMCIDKAFHYAEMDGVGTTDYIFLDGSLSAPNKFYKQKTIIGGDGKVFAISLASVLAKVARDEVMEEYDLIFPGYG